MKLLWFARFQPQLLAVLRTVVALLFLQHALIKLFGFPPGGQPGQQPIASLLGIGGLIELVTGVLVLLGLFTRPAAFIAAGEMAVAYWMVHAPRGFYPAVNMGEAAVLFCFAFLYLAAAGPGAWSIDGAREGRMEGERSA
jgi:putative oxidoreductase